LFKDVSVHRASSLPPSPTKGSPVKARKGVISNSDKVSFSKSSGGEEIWSLSRKKLENVRTLSSNLSAGSSVWSENDKSSSMDLSMLKLAPRSESSRRQTISVPRRIVEAEQKRQIVLTKEEVRELKKTLSDPMISVDMVESLDDVTLTEWLADDVPTRGRRRSVLELPPPQSVKMARSALRQLKAELDDRIPDPAALKELFGKREARLKIQFEAARENPLRHLETPIPGRTRAQTTRLEAQQLLSNMAAMAPAAPLSMSVAVSSSSAMGGKKLLVVRKDCVLNYDVAQERYVLKHATCDRMVVALVDRFWEVENDATLKKDKKAKKARLAEVEASARHFSIGSLKVVVEVVLCVCVFF
jgi:hypothetical protein